MMMHTALGLVIASLGVWTSAAPNGFPQQIFNSGLVGQITRCLLPPALTLPLVIGLLVFAFRNLAQFDINFGLAIMTVGNIVLSSLLCAWSARHIAAAADKQRHTEIALHESRQRLKAEAEQRRNLVRERVVEQTLLAREEEQQRIARDLHDGLGQLLTSLRFGISGIEHAASLTTIQQRLPLLRSQIVLGQAEIRRIISDLRPATLDELGLAPALGRLTAEFARDHNVQVSLDVTEVSERRLPPTQETAIYRIVQESLNNVARHAAATEVAVAITRRQGRLELQVSDNGRGIGASAWPGEGNASFGLIGMSERAALLDGEFHVGPRKPQGTLVEVVLPLA
jgi:signal transduction histidine kinase